MFNSLPLPLHSRGQDSEPREQSVRCQLEVAQLALPVLVLRAEAILRRYAAEDRHAAMVQQRQSASGTSPTGTGGGAGLSSGGAGGGLSGGLSGGLGGGLGGGLEVG